MWRNDSLMALGGDCRVAWWQSYGSRQWLPCGVMAVLWQWAVAAVWRDGSLMAVGGNCRVAWWQFYDSELIRLFIFNFYIIIRLTINLYENERNGLRSRNDQRIQNIGICLNFWIWGVPYSSTIAIVRFCVWFYLWLINNTHSFLRKVYKKGQRWILLALFLSIQILTSREMWIVSLCLIN